MIRVEIVADSLNRVNGSRLTSFICTYPRFIHAEVMTHRVFSRNAASSRAIPTKKLIAAASDALAMPEDWRANQSGMQPGGLLSAEQALAAEDAWRRGAARAIETAQDLAATGAHKQYVNRVLEPYLHMTTLITATDYENFFALRSHHDAQQEIQDLSDAMLLAYVHGTPTEIDPGAWHAPFRDLMPPDASPELQRQIATARSARLSYVSFDKAFTVADDIDMHDGLAASGHWSPFEHIAQATAAADRSGNIWGYTQYRKRFPHENRRVDLAALATTRAAVVAERDTRREAVRTAQRPLRDAAS